MREFSIVVAIDDHRGIGRDGRLPWHLPHDLKYFKEMTCRTEDTQKINAVVMGRKTWESIPPQYRPLSGRLNVVLTRQTGLIVPDQVLCVSSFEKVFDAIDQANIRQKVEQIFIIGGQSVFEQAIQSPFCERLYVTHVKHVFDCDTFFPAFNKSFERVFFSSCRNENDITYFFAEYARKISGMSGSSSGEERRKNYPGEPLK